MDLLRLVAQTASPMSLGFDHRHPGGMIENSPAFQRWDRSQRVLSPEGTAEDRSLSRPFGTVSRQGSGMHKCIFVRCTTAWIEGEDAE